MLGSLNRNGEENVSGIPGVWATRNFTYLARGPWGQPPTYLSLTSIYQLIKRLTATSFDVAKSRHITLNSLITLKLTLHDSGAAQRLVKFQTIHLWVRAVSSLLDVLIKHFTSNWMERQKEKTSFLQFLDHVYIPCSDYAFSIHSVFI